LVFLIHAEYKILYRKKWLTIVNARAVACYETGTAVSLHEAGEYCGDNIG